MFRLRTSPCACVTGVSGQGQQRSIRVSWCRRPDYVALAQDPWPVKAEMGAVDGPSASGQVMVTQDYCVLEATMGNPSNSVLLESRGNHIL